MKKRRVVPEVEHSHPWNHSFRASCPWDPHSKWWNHSLYDISTVVVVPHPIPHSPSCVVTVLTFPTLQRTSSETVMMSWERHSIPDSFVHVSHPLPSPVLSLRSWGEHPTLLLKRMDPPLCRCDTNPSHYDFVWIGPFGEVRPWWEECCPTPFDGVWEGEDRRHDPVSQGVSQGHCVTTPRRRMTCACAHRSVGWGAAVYETPRRTISCDRARGGWLPPRYNRLFSVVWESYHGCYLSDLSSLTHRG